MDEARKLKRGWTTGACATAASKAAFTALLTGAFPDPVEITLPNGQVVAFALAVSRKEENSATAGIVKDAGDDPDVTHGALVLATVRAGVPGSGVSFKAGPGDVEIEIAIPHGQELAAKTLNARLGILGGLSILGTTGVVVPYSCAAWIATIH